tara:strand:- start:313 stop:732 length:420 start_codon:yes stop_codon:yes gene_type:complete
MAGPLLIPIAKGLGVVAGGALTAAGMEAASGVKKVLSDRKKRNKKTVSDNDVIEALGISTSKPTGDETDNNDREESKKVLKLATSKQKAMARKSLGMNMGGMMTDELGYMQGGMTEEARSPIKYSKGGAIAGKNFKGSF